MNDANIATVAVKTSKNSTALKSIAKAIYTRATSDHKWATGQAEKVVEALTDAGVEQLSADGIRLAVKTAVDEYYTTNKLTKPESRTPEYYALTNAKVAVCNAYLKLTGQKKAASTSADVDPVEKVIKSASKLERTADKLKVTLALLDDLTTGQRKKLAEAIAKAQIANGEIAEPAKVTDKRNG